MKLKSAMFYQTVQLWDSNHKNTVNEKTVPGITLELIEHIVILRSPKPEHEIILVPTANLRFATTDDGYLQKFDEAVPPEVTQAAVNIVTNNQMPPDEVKLVPVGELCKNGHKYSRAMNQPRPRRCVVCEQPEEEKKE